MGLSKKNMEFLVSVLIILLTVFLMIAYYNRWFSFAERVGPFRIIHYVAWAGTIYIAITVILFSFYKRRSPQKTNNLARIHMFGNLISFLLVSLHFAGQVGRPADFYPDFGTGLALYVGFVVLTITGFVLKYASSMKFRPMTNRTIHVSMALAFYLIIIFHILHGLELI